MEQTIVWDRASERSTENPQRYNQLKLECIIEPCGNTLDLKQADLESVT